jgi:hypothetical protein
MAPLRVVCYAPPAPGPGGFLLEFQATTATVGEPLREPGAAVAALGPAAGQRTVAVALLTVGALLRIWQYAADTSFWLDEIAIAQNVVSRSFAQLLTEPLALGQVAPKGFLAVEKIATAALGSSELAFRFYALLCGLAALLLFWRLVTLQPFPSSR